MENNLEKVRQKLFSAKSSSDLMNDEIKTSVNKLKEEKLRKFKDIVDFKLLDDEDIEEFNKALKNISLAKIKGENVKNQLLNLQSESIVLEGKIEKINVFGLIFESVKKTLEAIIGGIGSAQEIVKKLTIMVLEQLKKDDWALMKKLVLLSGARAAKKLKIQSDAAALLNFSLTNGEQEYIFENGKLLDKVSDLHNTKLETIISTKLDNQLQVKDARGGLFHSESTLAKEIVESQAIKSFLHGKQELLLEKRMLDDASVYFAGSDSWNLHNALGHTDIIDIKLDKDNNLIAKIIDTYDFNKDDPNKLVQLARTVQDAKLLETFFEIIEIKIPYDMWIKY